MTNENYLDHLILKAYMRGGTSKGPFFDMRDSPQDITRQALSKSASK